MNRLGNTPHLRKIQAKKWRNKIWRYALCIVIAGVVHYVIKNNILEERWDQISEMQRKASQEWKPLIIHATKNDMGKKVIDALQWEKKSPEIHTTIINPPGEEPPIKIITPNATIIADKNGNTENIIPHQDKNGSTPTHEEAQSTVDEAIKVAAQKTLPPEPIMNPLSPPKKK